METSRAKVCRVIRSGDTYSGKQGLNYFSGVSAESCDSSSICMHLLVIPPGGRAKAHYHATHETAIYIMEGEGEFLHGQQLEHCDKAGKGDFVFIPAGVPHLPYNPSSSDLVAVVSRTDPNEQESVVLCPELEPNQA